MKELKEAVHAFIAFKHTFSVDDVKEIVDELIAENGSYKDPISKSKIKAALLEMFEKGDINGYCLIPRPIVDDNGPKCILEFSPHNPMSISKIEMLGLPENFERVSCRIHPYYKQILRVLSKTTSVSQDMIVRSILTRSLSLVFDQLK